jgi:L-fuculose-phosphate aldolase
MNLHALTEKTARHDIIEVCRRVYARGWLAATDGNASILIDDDRILCTPSGVHKGYMDEEQLIVVDRSGNRLKGDLPASSELAMHLAVYEQRPDVRAALHAHPTHCVALSLAGISLASCTLPEVILTLGSIPTIGYCTPTSLEVPAEIKKWIRDFDALILPRHGSLTVGSDIFDAFNKLERMEHVAEITFLARSLGPVEPLTCSQVEKIREAAQEVGLSLRKLMDSPCEPKASRSLDREDKESREELVRRVKLQVQQSFDGRKTSR